MNNSEAIDTIEAIDNKLKKKCIHCDDNIINIDNGVIISNDYFKTEEDGFHEHPIAYYNNEFDWACKKCFDNEEIIAINYCYIVKTIGVIKKCGCGKGVQQGCANYYCLQDARECIACRKDNQEDPRFLQYCKSCDVTDDDYLSDGN